MLQRLEKVLNFHPGELTRLAHLARTPADVLGALELREAQVRKLRGMVQGLMSGSSDGREDAAEARDLLADVPVDNVAPLLSAGKLVPIINSVAAGYPHEFTDLDYPPSVADEYIRCPGMDDPQAFAARVVGDSMEPDYRQGDVVVFSPNTPADNGNDCFVRFGGAGGTTFKRYYQDDERIIRLQPLNSRYPSQTYPLEDVTGIWPALFRVQQVRQR